MARGPRRKSAELHLKLGNPSKRNRKGLERAAATEAGLPAMAGADVPGPAVMPHGLEPPAWLDDVARRAWETIAPLIAPSLKASDAGVLARYCDVFARWLDAREAMRDGRASGGMRYTYTSKTRDGGKRQYLRPEYRILADAEREMRALEAVLPLSPASRATIYQRLADMQDPVRPPVPRPASTSAGAASPMPPASPIGILAIGKPN